MALRAAVVLAGAIDPHHDHVASGVVASGVGNDLVERAVATLAGQLADTGMLSDRPEARMLSQALNAIPDRAASRRQALGPDPGWVSQIVASSRSASASGAYISSRSTRNAG
jgi:hypothetical protein